MKTIQAVRIGSRAYQVTRTSVSGQVFGVTSRGVFLKISEAEIVFLSSDPYRNPLSVNLDPFPVELRQVNINDPIRLREGILSFIKPELEILIPSYAISDTPKTPRGTAPKVRRLNSLIGITECLKEYMEPNYLAYSLPEFFRGEIARIKPGDPPGVFLKVNESFARKDLGALLPKLTGFIGAGRGLTPAGDDLITGFLLAVNRWNPYRWPKDLVRTLNERVMNLAAKKTTTLSAAILAAAADGDADERLITALDSIFTGSPAPAQAAGLLLSYGSSSGSDAFCGMSLAIK